MARWLFSFTLLMMGLRVTVSINPGCRIRITSPGLTLVRHEGLKFVTEELENISIADLSGKEGPFQYSISGVRITDLDLSTAALSFQPDAGLCFEVNNSSISITFRRDMLYWLL
ncbi:phospholipid transfer protein-like isoform X2 [Heptranchias perlo]